MRVTPDFSAILIATWILLCGSAVAQDAGQLLFKELRTDQLTIAQQDLVSRVEKRTTTARTRPVVIEAASFSAKSLTANFFTDKSVDLEARDIGHTGVGRLKTWAGVSKGVLGSGAFIINGNRVSGHVTTTQANFEIIPLGETGSHLIIEHNSKEFESCGNLVAPQEINPDMERSPGPEKNETRTPSDNECFIRVLVAYTQGAKDSTWAVYGRTMIEHISLAILETNQGYANSDVDQRIELAYLYLTGDNETSNSQTDVNDLRDQDDGKWDEIHMYRDMYHADMVSLITRGSYSGICGRAYGFDYTDPANMFQLSEFDCVVGNYTFAHEFGHNQGCRHDIDLGTSPFSYGHGYNQGTVFRTIMAVCCDPERVNYWSNPWIFYPGGGMMGTVNFSNNALALNEGDSIVAHHRLNPMTSVTSDLIESDEMAFNRTIELIDAADTTLTGGKLMLNATTRIRLTPGFRALSGSQGAIRVVSTGCPINGSGRGPKTDPATDPAPDTRPERNYVSNAPEKPVSGSGGPIDPD